MAERKYDLALIDTVKNRPVKQQSWYKERLQTKYIKQLRPGERINSHNTNNWLFLKDGLDDFRDGLPPAVKDSDFIKSQKGQGPALKFVETHQVKEPAARKRLSRYQTYYSRVTPQQQQRRDYINEVEQGLLKHPLALYPHLEESVAPEVNASLKFRKKRQWRFVSVDQRKNITCYHINSRSTLAQLFEDIVDLLDPQFNINDLNDDDVEMLSKLEEQMEGGATSSQSGLDSERTRSVKADKDEALKDETDPFNQRNPYRWLPRRENGDSKDRKDSKKAKEREKSWPASQSEEEHIKQVTQDFCEWVADLGGESNNIEESTITSLFASGYETKPALSVPIHVVELTNVPQELRMSAAVPPPTPPAKQPSVGELPDKKITGDYEPSWVKFKYGAWYLSPRTWKKMDCNEPLEDPKQLKDHEMSEAKKKSHELNQELASMHASKAFSDFITKKSTRRPEFLVEVAEIQRKAAEEEQKRQEAESTAKLKKASIMSKESQVAST